MYTFIHRSEVEGRLGFESNWKIASCCAVPSMLAYVHAVWQARWFHGQSVVCPPPFPFPFYSGMLFLFPYEMMCSLSVEKWSIELVLLSNCDQVSPRESM